MSSIARPDFSFKSGKKDPTYDPRDLQFGHYRIAAGGALPQHPARFGHETVLPPGGWGMLGNDAHGDCVWAGGDHEHMTWERVAGDPAPAVFTPTTALADYAAGTGFDPVTGQNDNGTITRDALNYRRKTGLVDASGKRHKIGGFCAVEPGNWAHVLEALYIFEIVGMGFRFPNSAMDQFRAGKPWSIVAGSSIEGGHYVPLVAKRGRIVCVTWGHTQEITKGFFERYCDEAWAIYCPEILTKTGKSVEGFDVAAFDQDIKLIAA